MGSTAVAYGRFGLWLDRKMGDRAIPSQSELGRRIGETPSTVNRWMNGVITPNYDQVAALARVLGVSRYEAFTALGWLPDMTGAELEEIRELWDVADASERETIAAIARQILRDKLGKTQDDAEGE